MSDPTRYPLAWPAGRPRTSWSQQRNGKFSANGEPITLAKATERLTAELNRLGAIYVLISTDVETRRDGLPKSGQREPRDPGVCAYFTLRGKPFALACDTFDRLAQNIAALAAHVEATRAIERYGVASAAETLQAFSALPPPASAPTGPRPWWAVLGFGKDDLCGHSRPVRVAMINAAFSDIAKKVHPDRGGTDSAMAELNNAREAALKELAS